tara:strand:- start:10268 stop:11122 length:855 start_codon:yes stop_codon:yes gene_type:complete
MRLLIISGRSGSGKSVALQALEDVGYYCVDNLPVEMLPDLVSKLRTDQPRLAISIDSRNLPKDTARFKEIVAQLKQTCSPFETAYLDAKLDIILKRFSETRRKHPLTTNKLSLNEAIEQERELLSPIANCADITIDTTQLSKHDLCRMIREKVANEKANNLQLLVQSFGFKNGIPMDADFMFDVRCLPNPYWHQNLRNFSGLDDEIAQFLTQYHDVKLMIEDVLRFLDNWIPRFESDNRSYLTVGIGCTGGQHRSVFVAEQIAKQAQHLNLNIQIRHRDIKLNL